jgi:DnaJ domain
VHLNLHLVPGDPFEHFGGGGGGGGGAGRRASGPIDNKEFYEILGVPQDADENVIKKAYRKLALKVRVCTGDCAAWGALASAQLTSAPNMPHFFVPMQLSCCSIVSGVRDAPVCAASSRLPVSEDSIKNGCVDGSSTS